MNGISTDSIVATSYDRSVCELGIVHLGFGAFHRSHQAVYIDDYMNLSGDLRWGIAAVNLRSADSLAFESASEDIRRHDGYFLKSYSADGKVNLRRVRSHVHFSDWTNAKTQSEDLLALASVHLVTTTVTESGYYTDMNGDLNLADPTIEAEVSGDRSESIYDFLRQALAKRLAANGAPLTIACCDNIRQNGKMLERNLLTYLKSCNQLDLADWVEANVVFPCSMVDRITPRSPNQLSVELSELVDNRVTSPVMAEDFTQWVLQSAAASEMPQLEKVGVTVTNDVDPYEETKIRVLNGGHTALAYFAALEGVETFDAAMRVPHLFEHFENFQKEEVLPALTLDLPFSKEAYLQAIVERFYNAAIGDTVARICADGMAKFPIFICPTLRNCLRQEIMPLYSIRSIASWYVFARHVAAGKMGFEYLEPSWNDLKALLGTDAFVTHPQLWGELPTAYPEFANNLRREINDMELKWPV